MTINTGGGNDIVRVFGLAAHSLSINTGTGDDTVSMQTSFAFDPISGSFVDLFNTLDSLSIHMGSGADTFSARGVDVTSGLGVVDGGPGTDVYQTASDLLVSGVTPQHFEALLVPCTLRE